jgi:hypothetical protein
MKIAIVSAMVLGLAAPAAFADEPVTLTDTQMDIVKAGATCSVLSCITLSDTVDVNKNNISVPVNAAVAANILGGGALANANQRPGNQRQ